MAKKEKYLGLVGEMNNVSISHPYKNNPEKVREIGERLRRQTQASAKQFRDAQAYSKWLMENRPFIDKEQKEELRAPHYYSLIRYMHDVESGEFVNVGVLMYSVRTGGHVLLMSYKTTRAKKLFGDLKDWDAERFEGHISAFAERIQYEFDNKLITNVADLIRFIHRRANSMIMSGPHGILVDVGDSMEEKTRELFKRLVR